MLLLQLLDLSNGWNCRQIEFYKLKREENIAMKQLPRKKYIFEGKNQVHGLPQLMEKRDAHQIEFFMRYIGLMFLQRLLFQHIQSWNIRLIFFSLMQLRSVGSLSEVSHSKRPPWHNSCSLFSPQGRPSLSSQPFIDDNKKTNHRELLAALLWHSWKFIRSNIAL